MSVRLHSRETTRALKILSGGVVEHSHFKGEEEERNLIASEDYSSKMFPQREAQRSS